ncbi:hypothetical protein [Xanthobacter agilis]|uniref:Uncharacterized protein n=2 Tax=Xanthobacter agilis TaxID=47492 RepID=A0ABU0L8A0_XANAG|nr:hypothetical protein [Xanthobacter agilis]MDQ0503328.1 hypothetical protein [Xanthobacter agilis]
MTIPASAQTGFQAPADAQATPRLSRRRMAVRVTARAPRQTPRGAVVRPPLRARQRGTARAKPASL